jgi:RHS repeat-associated protein
VIARYTSAGTRTYLTDALGSVIAQTNDQQAVQNFYGYTPYGETQALGPDEGNPIQYTARENDGTALYFYRARYYDPVLKRFVSEDPIGLGAGTNVYAYVGGDPIGFTDPDGLNPKRSPRFICVNCGAFHGGGTPYCPDCLKKSQDPNGGVPPLWVPPVRPGQPPKGSLDFPDVCNVG